MIYTNCNLKVKIKTRSILTRPPTKPRCQQRFTPTTPTLVQRLWPVTHGQFAKFNNVQFIFSYTHLLFSLYSNQTALCTNRDPIIPSCLHTPVHRVSNLYLIQSHCSAEHGFPLFLLHVESHCAHPLVLWSICPFVSDFSAGESSQYSRLILGPMGKIMEVAPWTGAWQSSQRCR